jgi:lipoprotein NlpI
MSYRAWAIALIAISSVLRIAGAETPSPPSSSEVAAKRAERLKALIAEATLAIEAEPNDKGLYARRAALYSAAEEHSQAIADYDKVLKLDPQSAAAYDQRGSEHFTLGHIDESIDDFDRFIKLRPAEEPRHWKRGISYYYAGKWEQGRRQFEGYQTVDDNDVENAVWRYLCMARGQGVQAARESILPIKMDGRVPMMTVYALYAGRAQPDDVMQAAEAGSPSTEALNARLFYAHLYLGLYFEAAGDQARALEHIATAAEKHKIGHYMWNVADVHAKRLKAAGGK